MSTIGFIRLIGVGSAAGVVFVIINERGIRGKGNVTKEKCREVLELYEASIGVAKASLWSDHLKSMIPKMRGMLDDGDRQEKFMRWLGFMQGVFWVIGWFSLEDLKRHNRVKEEDAA